MNNAGRGILTVSAGILAIAGTAALFAPDELARAIDGGGPPATTLAIQLVGSGLLGFAVLDSMSRGNRIGGIYGRPVGLANLMTFVTASLSLGKAGAAGTLPPVTLPACAVTGAMALAYAWLVFVHDPLGSSDGTKP